MFFSDPKSIQFHTLFFILNMQKNEKGQNFHFSQK